MADLSKLTEQEQNELLSLLEDEQDKTFTVLHSVSRPLRPGMQKPVKTAAGQTVLVLRRA